MKKITNMNIKKKELTYSTPELQVVPQWFEDYYKETFYKMVTLAHARISSLQARMVLDLHEMSIPSPYNQKLLEELAELNNDVEGQEELIQRYTRATVFGYTTDKNYSNI